MAQKGVHSTAEVHHVLVFTGDAPFEVGRVLIRISRHLGYRPRDSYHGPVSVRLVATLSIHRSRRSTFSLLCDNSGTEVGVEYLVDLCSCYRIV